jgi:capsular exopolysaccharide synthesis family protein
MSQGKTRHQLSVFHKNKSTAPQKVQKTSNKTERQLTKHAMNKKKVNNISEPQELKKRDESDNQPAQSQDLLSLLSIMGVESESNNSNGKTMRDYLYSIRKYSWLIISITLICTTLVAIYMARKPDIFTAQARVEVSSVNNPAINTSQNTAVIVNSPASDPNYINTQLQILTGAGFLRRVVKTLDLEHNPDFLRPSAVRNLSTWSNLKQMVGIGNGSKSSKGQKQEHPNNLLVEGAIAPAATRDDDAETKRLDPYVRAIQGKLVVFQIQNTNLIGILYDHSDPHIAAKVVNGIADTFVYANFENMLENNRGNGNFLQQRIAELQAQIRNGEERLINYSQNRQILSLDPSQNIVVDRLTALNRQLLEAENERKIAEAAYRTALSPGAADALANNGSQSGAEQQLANLKQRRAQMLVQLTEENPEVQEIDAQIAILQKQITDAQNQTRNVFLTNLKTRYEQAQAREQSLRDAFEKQKRETVSQNEAAINYRIIEQEIQTNRTLLNDLLQRSKQNDFISIGTSNNMRVTDYAMAPDSPVSPKRMQGVGVAFVVSLAFAIGIAILLGYLDDTLRSPDQVEQIVGIPTLASIPPIKNNRKLLKAKDADPLLLNTDRTNHELLVLNGNSRSPLAEIYRKLRTSIMLSANGNPSCAILVTSSMPAEGKTTTAVNTALTLAQTDARVIVVDADFRHPCIHSLLGLSNNKGLQSVLNSDVSEPEIARSIQRYDNTNLFVLTSGDKADRPSEILGSEKMRRLLSILRTKFTYIVIDSPPLALFTDGVLLSSMADGVLLVAESCKSSGIGVKSARRLLESTGAKILGVVLNKAKVHENSDYYYYNYYRTHDDS